MRLRILSALVALTIASYAVEERSRVVPVSGDWREAIKLADTGSPDSLVRHLAEGLKQSKVPTEDEAKRRAFALITDARSIVSVNALLRLAKPVKDLGATGDLVWEVRVVWAGDLADVIWVGASTGNARSLFPK